MLQTLRGNNQKGFTLIELMIVIAIIGILAAIAIPQFAAYRMRAFNSSSQSDARNTKTAQEVLQVDHQAYGASENAALPGGGHAGGAGAELAGPLGAATDTVAGGVLTTTTAAGVIRGMPMGVGNQVYLQADTEAGGTGSFIITARHRQGNRAYAADSDSTAIYFIEDAGMVGLAALTVTPVVAVVGQDDMAPSGTVTAGGTTGQVSIAEWTAQ